MKNICGIIILMILPLIGVSQTEESRIKHFNVKKDVAIGGYDPVSYFSGKVSEGKDNIQFNHMGVIYLFANEVNKKSFVANPEKYEPQYGGWCAYAMGANGEKVKVDPETFKIVDDKLYLFYNFYFNNTLEDWNENESKLRHSADENWSKIIN